MKAYLNWAMLSKPSERVRRRALEAARDPLTDVCRQRMELRRIFAERMEIEADRVCLTYNTTSAMALASHLLGFGYSPTPKIIAGDSEWASMLNVLKDPNHEEANRGLVTLHVTEPAHSCTTLPANRVEADFVWNPNDGEGRILDLLDENSGKGAVLLLSEVQRTTGRFIPVRKICGRARENGIKTVIDAAQILAPHSLLGAGPDAYVGCFHKNIGAIPALGFLVVSVDMLRKTGAKMLREIENRAMIYAPAVVAAAEALREFDSGSACTRVRELGGILLQALARPGIQILQDPEISRHHIFSFRIAERTKDVAECLKRAGWEISYLPEIDAIRVSIGPRNSAGEIEGFGKAVAELAS